MVNWYLCPRQEHFLYNIVNVMALIGTVCTLSNKKQLKKKKRKKKERYAALEMRAAISNVIIRQTYFYMFC